MTGLDAWSFGSLRSYLSDWTEHDEASFVLGKILGVIEPNTSYSEIKYIFFSDPPNDIGLRLLDILIFLVNQGILESREHNSEFRWKYQRLCNDES